MLHRNKTKVSEHNDRGRLAKLMASAFDDTWLQSNAVVEPPTAPEEFDGDLDDIRRFIAYTKSSQPGPRLVAVQTFLWLCAHSSLADVQDKVFPATTRFATDDDNSVREAVAAQVAHVISYLRANSLWGGSCFVTFWETCVALLTEKDAQIRIVCEDNVASVAEYLSDPLVLQPIVLPSFVCMLREDEDAVCTALRLMAEIATHSPSEWVRDSVWPVFSEQVRGLHLLPLAPTFFAAIIHVIFSFPIFFHPVPVQERQFQSPPRRCGAHWKSRRRLRFRIHFRAHSALLRRALQGNASRARWRARDATRDAQQDGVWGVRRNCAVALADLSKAFDAAKRCDLCAQ